MNKTTQGGIGESVPSITTSLYLNLTDHIIFIRYPLRTWSVEFHAFSKSIEYHHEAIAVRLLLQTTINCFVFLKSFSDTALLFFFVFFLFFKHSFFSDIFYAFTLGVSVVSLIATVIISAAARVVRKVPPGERRLLIVNTGLCVRPWFCITLWCTIANKRREQWATDSENRIRKLWCRIDMYNVG